MIEASESLLPRKRSGTPKALIPVCFSHETAQEFVRLLETLSIPIIEPYIVSLKQIHPGTYLTQGKLESVHELATQHQVEGVAFDADLTPNQLKNLGKF